MPIHPPTPPAPSPPLSPEPYVLGVDLGGTHLRLALARTTGELRARWSTSTVGIRDPHRIVALITEGAAALLSQLHLLPSALRSVAVAAPGITDVDRGIVIATSYLLGWRNVPLKALLEATLHIPATIDNDVNVATLAESCAGAAQGSPNFAFIAIGTGIGAGIFLGGRLLRGSNWLAGEIGYMFVPGVPEIPVAEDAPGALESVAGGHAIRSRWQAAARSAHPPLPPDLSATEIFDLATTAHPVTQTMPAHPLAETPPAQILPAQTILAQTILAETARVLAFAVYNLSLIVNVPLVVFGGGVGVHPALIAAVQAQLDQHHAHATPRILPSALGADAQLLGAIHLAIELAANQTAPRA